MKLSKRENKLVAVALLAAVVFVYYTYFLSPKIEEYAAIKELAEQNKQELGSLQDTETEMTELQKDIENDKREIARLEESIPSRKMVPDIIVVMETLSAETGLDLKGITFSPPAGGEDKNVPGNKEAEEEKDYVEIPVKLSLVGTYRQILDFLKQVEDYGRLYSVRGINLSRQYETSGSSIAVEADIIAYAVKHDGKLLDDPVTYEFMNGTYGREDPFEPLQHKAQENTASQPATRSTTNTPSDEFVEDMIEKMFDQILKDLVNQ